MTYLAYVWGDIEDALEAATRGYTDALPEEARVTPAGDDAESYTRLWEAVRAAARVEVRTEANGTTPYVLVYDNASEAAKEARRTLDQLEAMLAGVIVGWSRGTTSAWRFRTELLPPSAVPRGTVCRRSGDADPPPSPARPSSRRRSGGVYGLQEHDGYLFDSPAAVLFYDALKESDLIFVVEPTVQHRGERRRPDFLVLVGGRTVRVEIDGYEFHAKTREQQSRDAEKDRWYLKRGVQTIRFTGRQVNADAAGCVRELINVLKGREAYPE